MAGTLLDRAGSERATRRPPADTRVTAAAPTPNMARCPREAPPGRLSGRQSIMVASANMSIEAGESRTGQEAPPRLPPAPATRFVPPRLAPAASVVRPRLLEALHAGLPRRATVVMAPAGYGKTTLLAQFAAEVDALACWCELDEGDRDARVLLSDLVAAIAQRLPGFGERVLEALPGGDDPAAALRAATGLFIAELQE